MAIKEANNELIQTLEKLHQFQRQMVQNEKWHPWATCLPV